jgi:hypothetical protein
MARNKNQTSVRRRHSKDEAREEARDEANKHRFVDQSGIVAQDLPGAEHGQNVVDPPEQMSRNLPQQHGGELDGEGGLRGDRNLSDADDHGGRKRN